METNPDGVLQRVAEAALRLCGGGSAGLSLEDFNEEGERVFRWIAVAGAYESLLGIATPGDFGPCGVAVDLRETQIFLHPERLYDYLLEVKPSVIEGIFTPYRENDRTVGTLWVMTHEPGKEFDSEDRRLLEGLADFAATARRALAARSLQAEREAEQIAFQESEALLDRVLKSSPDCIKIVGLDGKLKSMNEAGLALLEIDDFETMRDVSWGDIWSGEERELAIQAIAEARRGGVARFEAAGTSLKGREIWFEIQVSPILGIEGRPQNLLVISRDVTERHRLTKELAAERLQLRQLLDEVPEHIVTLRGPELYYDFVNRRFKEFAGEKETAGKRVGEVWPVPEEHVRILKNVVETGMPFTGTEAPVPYPLQPGKIGYFDFAFRPQRGPDGAITGVLVHSLDVTERVLARRELARSEAQFRAAQENTPDGFTVLESVRNEAGEIVDFRWTYANKAMGRLSGDAPADFLGKSMLELRPAVKQSPLFDTYRRVVETGEPWTGEVLFPYRKGSMYLRITAVKVEDGFAAWTVDLTERKRMEERLAFMRTLTETVVDLRDPVDIIESAQRMLGEHLVVDRCAYGEVGEDEETFTINRDWVANGQVSLTGAYFLSSFGHQVCDALRAGKSFFISDTEVEIEEGDAREAFRELGVRSTICCPLIKGGKLVAMVAVHHSQPRQWKEIEIETVEQVADRMWAEVERARAERALRKVNDDLDARVKERTQELADTVKEAEAFNYAISHDLRAPLRAIASTSRILLEEAGKELATTHRELLDRQAHNATRLGVLIDELLKLSRLARVQVRRTTFDMSALAEDVVEELVRAGLSNGCRIEVAKGMRGNGDPQLVRLVLGNLLSNACKFSTNAEPVTVGKDGKGTFFVRDQGVGFDMAYANKVFLPFERLVTESQFPGTGIGLANVDRIIRRHGGRVWAESAPGAGATFFFTLHA